MLEELHNPDANITMPYGLIMPEPAEWGCEIVSGYIIHPAKGREPNAFWRWMQHLAFGFRWHRVGGRKN